MLLQVRVTGRLQQLLPSFVPSIFGLGTSAAIDKVVVDDERQILYTLSQSSAIQVRLLLFQLLVAQSSSRHVPHAHGLPTPGV